MTIATIGMILVLDLLDILVRICYNVDKRDNNTSAGPTGDKNMQLNLTGGQIQKLMDNYNLNIDLVEGVVCASRKNGKILKAETIARMLGIKDVPSNWKEDKYGWVCGL